jgi:alcohol dehydrogenase (cytochrome c)
MVKCKRGIRPGNWSYNFPKSQLFGSVSATAGELAFAGGTNDRNSRAFDAKTGELLREQKTNSGIMGMPIAYAIEGTEYIAVQSGWGVDAQRIQDALATANNIGVENNVPQGGVVWEFAVKK